MIIGEYKLEKLDEYNWTLHRGYATDEGGPEWKRLGYYPTLTQAATKLLDFRISDEQVEDINGLIEAIDLAKCDIIKEVRKNG